MRPYRFLLALGGFVLVLTPVRAGDPVTVELLDRATVGTALVTVGDVATLSGGDAATRGQIARLDLAEFKAREPNTTIGRRSVEYRLMLAQVEARVTGAERATVIQTRRAVTVEEATMAARTELFRYYANPADPVAVELALPVAVKLPEVPSAERVVITGKPRGVPGALGRVQMDMTITIGSEQVLSFPVYFDVQSASRAGPPGAGGRARGPGPPPATGEVLIQPRQRVQIQVPIGGYTASTLGEALQAGKLGQTISVQNVDSKKVLSGRVTGPGTVTIDIGGAP